MAIVRMTTLECGPNGNFPEGSLREVTFEQGEMLVNTRHAEWVAKGIPAPRQIEVVRIQEPERAFVEVAANPVHPTQPETRKPARR